MRSRAEHWPRDTDTVMEPAIHSTATRHIASRTTAPATGTAIRPTEPMATHLMAIPTPTLYAGGVGGGGKGRKVKVGRQGRRLH
jgi:hypothetical protein